MLHRIYRVLALSLCFMALALGALAPAAMAMPDPPDLDGPAIPVPPDLDDPAIMPAAALVTCTSTGSGNWDTPSTWSCGQVPTIADDVTILAYPHGDGECATAAVNTLTVNTGGKLVLNANTLTLAGSWHHWGTFEPGTGTVVFAGTSAEPVRGRRHQSISLL